MNKVEEPLRSLYQDLRRQRLLPVVAILIVAIVLVPMALGAGGEPTPPQTALAAGIAPLVKSEPVVLPATPELRDFHKRLNEFAKKNPFHQPQPLKVAGSGSGSNSSDTSGTGTDATTAGSTATDTGGSISLPPGVDGTTDTGTTGTGSTDTTDTTGTGSTSGTGASDSGGTSASDGSTGDGQSGSSDGTGDGTSSGDSGTSSPTETNILSHLLDVKVGPAGSMKEINGVKSLDFLPSASNPLLQYVTSDLGGNRASFVVSSDVIRATGDGRCAPSPNDCRFLQLKVGQSEQLDDGSGDGLYGVKLLGITQKLNPLKKLSDAAGDVSGRIGFSAGLSG